MIATAKPDHNLLRTLGGLGLFPFLPPFVVPALRNGSVGMAQRLVIVWRRYLRSVNIVLALDTSAPESLGSC